MDTLAAFLDPGAAALQVDDFLAGGVDQEMLENRVRAWEAVSTRTVSIRDDAIRLGQFLKLADLIDQGADARQAIASGQVRVNGEVERRRGRQLTHGDEVEVRGEFVEVG